MRTIVCLTTTAILLGAPLEFALAQNTPDSGASAAPATTTAPLTTAPSTPTAPAAAPAAPTQPANAPAAADSAPKEGTVKDSTQKTKKKKAAGITRRREIEKSIESGTVPSRYRSSVPKEYQQYIPFSKD